ncbi:ubiquitin carboxyl-terminal hydrolase 25-like [Saccoglossus kowalevskii]|uniref:Ubiquitin carboxyl-terminal hydrolase 25-like n=1 Tax=Saccoglossus kowalevskii TaxID=10224 RepID=A0ABM0MZM3_SACKO|nr:PREDICTED: ubiquitin carboxyl-terminal hydrolase 25-like [Saccoglossus kowalevskii]
MEALPYFVYSYKHNEVIHPKTKYSSLDENLVSLYRRECLLQLNDQCAQAFEADDQSEADFSLKTVEDYVVPCLGILSNSEHPEDSAAAEDIRDRWYSLLGQEINASLQEKFQDFLPKLIDVSADVCTLKMPPLSRLRKSHDLAERYAEMMELVISSGLFSTNNLKS